MRVENRYDDLSDVVQIINHARALTVPVRRRFLAAIGDRIAEIYAPLMDPHTASLMQQTIRKMWAGGDSSRDGKRLLHAWHAKAADKYIQLSVGYASCVYFFRFAAQGLVDSDVEAAPLEYMANVFIYLSSESTDALKRGKLTVQRPRSSEVDSRPAWVRAELTLQACLLEIAAREESAGRLLTQEVASTACRNAREHANAAWATFWQQV